MEALIPVVFILWGVVWVWALVEIGSTPPEAFSAAGESKTVWFLLVLVLQFFGLLAYLLSTRRRIRAHIS
jgi:hypothetical protein